MKQWFDFIKSQEDELGSATVQKWLLSLKILSYDAGNIYLEAKDSIQALWFEEHIRPKTTTLFNSNGRNIKVHIKVAGEKKAKLPEKKSPVLHLKADLLLQDATFSSFYENEKNKLAFKLLSESSNQPIVFNPILLYGPEDSGKTHLLMAAAKAFEEKGKKVFFVKAQTFTDHVVSAIRFGALASFRNIYRNAEVLIVDDVHLLGGKNATQEEFFHTFNTLHTGGTQIILSSRPAPSQMKDIEPRLISRFEWGIALSVERVDDLGLKAILEKKISFLDLSLSAEIKDFLLKTFLTPSGIQRALQALLLRTEKKNLHLNEVIALLSDLIKEKEERKISFDQIVKSVAKHFGLSKEDILGSSQTKECAFPRHLAMFLCREKLKIPYQQIGKLFSRDHSTVMTNIKNVEQRKIAKDNDVYFALQSIDRLLK